MSEQTIEEQQNLLKNKKIHDNAAIIANVIELVGSVVARVSTNAALAYKTTENNLTRSVLFNTVGNSVKSKLKER